MRPINKDVEELARQIYVKWISKEVGLSYGTYVSMAIGAISVATAFYEGRDKMENIDPPPLSKSRP